MAEQPSNSHPGTYTDRKVNSIDYLPALFLAAAIVFLPLGSESSSLNSLAIVFVSIVLEAIPFMMIGSLVGGFIEAFVSRERMATLLPRKGWLTVCIAAGAGLVFPVCECAVVPVVRRLTGKGLPFSAAIAYLLGGPIVNPIVAASTALAYTFDWRIVVLRLSLGYGIAVAIGLLMGRLFTSVEAIKNSGAEFKNNALSCGCHPISLEHTHHETRSEKSQPFPVITNPAGNSMDCGCGCSHPVSDGWVDKAGAAFSHAMDDFLAVGHYLVIGAFIAALAQTYIDRSSFLSLTAAPVLSVVLMMALAILLNLCSEADAFIAASFRGLMPIPAQMAFLLTGPMFDLKLLLMYQNVFTRRAIVVLASLILAAVLVIAVGLEMLNGVLR
ncbi:MAG: permease [Desulfobacteraceae bacterium]|jgi:uncharacterized membrane protein YraQ (UPF0718 family)